uniref:Integrator complex subunit 14 n=1 Tax=Plectus sambesii TaxID=2011161 RepID=A0A914VA36_9BILA
MPTLVALDVSLSMGAPVAGTDPTTTRKSLAIAALTHFLQVLADSSNKHEQFALATFSREATLLHPFGRDAAGIVSSLIQLETSSKTSVAPILRLAAEQCGRGWANGSECRVIIVTDGCGSLLDPIDDITLPLPGRTVLHAVFLCGRSAASTERHRQFVELLTRNNGAQGPTEPVYLSSDTPTCAVETFGELIRKYYAPAYSLLRCGFLTTSVQLCPAPRAPDGSDIAHEIDIVGFIKPSEISNAPVATRHLVLPLAKGTDEDSAPNLCVLLHGSIKVEGMAAICRIGENWYGALYHMPDSKRSNLTLNCFHQSNDSVPWLGKLNQLTVRPFTGEAQGKDAVFPVGGGRFKPSYAANPTWWVEPYGLQSDVQKVLRYVKKLPDRQAVFYQELNRVCQQALALGFIELLQKMAEMFEKEAALPTSSADVKKHCAHVAVKLKETPQYGEAIDAP